MKITVEFDSLAEFRTFLDWKAGIDTSVQKTPIHGSGLEIRMINSLKAEQIEFVEDAQALPDACILKMPNIGRTSLARLRAWRRAEKGV